MKNINQNLTLFIGKNDQTTAFQAKTHDTNAYLVTIENLHQQHTGTIYTSLPDLSDETDLARLCRLADTIVYTQPEEWNNVDRTNKKFINSEQYLVEKIITSFSLARNKNIINCPPMIHWLHLSIEEISTMTKLVDRRNTDEVQLWAVGCSFTYGMGVSVNERYPNILSERLQLPLALLANPATSITWAANQILCSDIRKDDIVVWGLTSWNRFAHYDKTKNTVENIHVGYYGWFPAFNKTVSLDYLDSPTLLYNSINAINQVANFCKKIGAKLLIANLLCSQDLAEYLKNNFDNFVQLIDINGIGIKNRWLDLSDNNWHPGVISHIHYADNIEATLRELKYI